MRTDERDLLNVLRFELAFLDEGGYHESRSQVWRPRFYLEDSPSCMNADSGHGPAACRECVLAQLVPPEFLDNPAPCRHIPLNAAGETLDSLYRHSHGKEIEHVLRSWLQSTIKTLEERRGLLESENYRAPIANAESVAAVAMFESGQPRCANPACSHSFHWLGGGKFFRFHLDEPSPGKGAQPAGSSLGPHGVKHFWLCDPCSILYTLVWQLERGVRLTPACAARSAGSQL